MADLDRSPGDDVEWGAALRDGTMVDIVRMRPEDAERLVRFHRTLSAESTHRRFFAIHPELSERELARFTRVDHIDREALIAKSGDEIVGVARFERLSPGGDVAEVALIVTDLWQGRGLGTALFGRLLELARRGGIRHLTAEVLRYNTAMLTVFRHAGLAITERSDGEVVHVGMTDAGAP